MKLHELENIAKADLGYLYQIIVSRQGTTGNINKKAFVVEVDNEYQDCEVVGILPIIENGEAKLVIVIR